jgi:hypothetical protein
MILVVRFISQLTDTSSYLCVGSATDRRRHLNFLEIVLKII